MYQPYLIKPQNGTATQQLTQQLTQQFYFSEQQPKNQSWKNKHTHIAKLPTEQKPNDK